MCNGLLVGIGLRHSWSILIIFPTIFLFLLSGRKGFCEFPGQSDKVKIVFQLCLWKQQPCYLISALGLIGINFIVSCFVTRGWKLLKATTKIQYSYIELAKSVNKDVIFLYLQTGFFKNIFKAWAVLWKTVS